MKYIQVIALAIFFHIVMNIFMPWWNIFLAGLIAGYFSKLKAIQTWILVFAGIFTYWLILIIKIDHSNTGVFSDRLVQLFELQSKSLLFCVNAMIGGICAACGSQLGFYLKALARKIKES